MESSSSRRPDARRPSSPTTRLVGLAALAVLAAGVWWTWPERAVDESVDPLASEVRVPSASHDDAVGPRTSAEHPVAAVAQPDDAVTVVGDEDREASARPDDAALWSRSHAALQAATDGTLRAEDVARLCADLLTRVDEQRVSFTEDGHFKVYELLDEDGVGAARLTLPVDEHPRSPRMDFALRIDLATAPVFYTGIPDDGVESSFLTVGLELDDEGGLEHCTTLGLTDFVESPRWFDDMLGRPPQPMGGTLTVRREGAAYRPMTIQARHDDAGVPLWANEQGEPVERGGPEQTTHFDGVVSTLAALRP